MLEEVEEREVMPQTKTIGSLNGDLVSLVEALEALAQELGPQLKKITAELGPTGNRIKANLDKDETTMLVEKLSANTGTFLELVSLLETVKDLTGELGPKLKKMTAEVSPMMNRVKANLDKDETFLLVEKLSANTGTLLEMVSLLEAGKDLVGELGPKLKKMTAEVSPLVNSVKANLDKEETFLLIEKLSANTGTLLEMVSLMEAGRDLLEQLGTKKSALMHELSPKMQVLRKFADDDDLWKLIDNSLVLKGPVAKFVDDLIVTDEAGEASAPLIESTIGIMHVALALAGTPLVRNLIAAAATAINDAKESDIQPVSPLGMVSALRDEDVQRATGFLFYLLKEIGKNLKVTNG